MNSLKQLLNVDHWKAAVSYEAVVKTTHSRDIAGGKSQSSSWVISKQFEWGGRNQQNSVIKWQCRIQKHAKGEIQEGFTTYTRRLTL